MYFVVDISVLAAIYALAAYLTWNSIRLWRIPELAIPAASIAVALPYIKTTVLRGETDPVRRLAKLQFGVMAAYSLLAVYLVLSRAYYSRFFLLVSLAMITVWLIVDTLFISHNLRPVLVGVPSAMVDRLRQLPNASIAVLSRPELVHKADGIVVDLHEKMSPEWQAFIAKCAASGVQVYHAAAVFEALTGRVPLSHLSEGLVNGFFSNRTMYLRVKRLLDVLAVILFIPLLLPLAAFLGILIKLDSPGPVLYWQTRIGQGGVPFRIVKFRSMRVDAEANGAQQAADNDPRVTRVGRIMRRFRLDELPQFWNVLRGEMSLIGPRPEQAQFVTEYEREIPYYSWRHHVKPGISGWAQVQDGYAASLDDTLRKVEYDLYYVKHLSFWLDLSIIIRTIGTVLSGNGAR